MNNLKSIEREINRASWFFCDVLRCPANRQIFGDWLMFHLQVVLHHLDEANRSIACWKDVNCVEDESSTSC